MLRARYALPLVAILLPAVAGGVMAGCGLDATADFGADIDEGDAAPDDGGSDARGDGGDAARDGGTDGRDAAADADARDGEAHDADATSLDAHEGGDAGDARADAGDAAEGDAGDASTGDANTSDATSGEASTADANDASTGDANANDASTGDANASDASTGDANASDASTGDASTGDANTSDAGSGDSGAGDAGSGDSGAGDAGGCNPGGHDEDGDCIRDELDNCPLVANPTQAPSAGGAGVGAACALAGGADRFKSVALVDGFGGSLSPKWSPLGKSGSWLTPSGDDATFSLFGASSAVRLEGTPVVTAGETMYDAILQIDSGDEGAQSGAGVVFRLNESGGKYNFYSCTVFPTENNGKTEWWYAAGRTAQSCDGSNGCTINPVNNGLFNQSAGKIPSSIPSGPGARIGVRGYVVDATLGSTIGCQVWDPAKPATLASTGARFEVYVADLFGLGNGPGGLLGQRTTGRFEAFAAYAP